MAIKTPRIRSDSPKHLRMAYKVMMTAEFYKELTVSAISPDEAKRLAEERVRARQSAFLACGYSIGDIEIIGVEE